MTDKQMLTFRRDLETNRVGCNGCGVVVWTPDSGGNDITTPIEAHVRAAHAWKGPLDKRMAEPTGNGDFAVMEVRQQPLERTHALVIRGISSALNMKGASTKRLDDVAYLATFRGAEPQMLGREILNAAATVDDLALRHVGDELRGVGVWVVGNSTAESDKGVVWEIQGVFDTEQLALGYVVANVCSLDCLAGVPDVERTRRSQL